MKPYHVLTHRIISKMENEPNPVTRSSYRVILGNRIDRAESFRLSAIKRLEKIEKALGILND